MYLWYCTAIFSILTDAARTTVPNKSVGGGGASVPPLARSQCSLRCTTGARGVTRLASLLLSESALRRVDHVAASTARAGRRPPTGGPHAFLPVPGPAVGRCRQQNHGCGGGAPAAGSPAVERDPSPPPLSPVACTLRNYTPREEPSGAAVAFGISGPTTPPPPGLCIAGGPTATAQLRTCNTGKPSRVGVLD